jgi:hypothetical protein
MVHLVRTISPVLFYVPSCLRVKIRVSLGFSARRHIFTVTVVIASSVNLCARYIRNMGHEDFAVHFPSVCTPSGCVFVGGGGGRFRIAFLSVITYVFMSLVDRHGVKILGD